MHLIKDGQTAQKLWLWSDEKPVNEKLLKNCIDFATRETINETSHSACITKYI